ncbi:MAG: signal peptidase II [Opitutales bacterium]
MSVEIHVPERKTYGRLLWTAALVFILDQASKFWISQRLPFGTYRPEEAITLIPDFFYLVHLGNRGAAWGILEGQGVLLSIAALAALAAIYCFRNSLQLHRHSQQWIFGLLIGGILGNLLDRLLHGHVIDFFDLHFPFSIPFILEGGRYPAFNIADSGIVIGVGAYLVLSFFEKEPDELQR